MTHDGRNHFLGYHDNEEDAAEAAANFRRANMPYAEKD